jgi:hypothetical protein
VKRETVPRTADATLVAVGLGLIGELYLLAFSADD